MVPQTKQALYFSCFTFTSVFLIVLLMVPYIYKALQYSIKYIVQYSLCSSLRISESSILSSMAYVFKLPQTVTEKIMRYAIGYPRERLCSVATGIRRSDRHLEDRHDFFEGTHIAWYSVHWYHMLDHRLSLYWNTPPCWDMRTLNKMEYDKKRRLRRLQQQCEPCEPTELELQRMYF